MSQDGKMYRAITMSQDGKMSAGGTLLAEGFKHVMREAERRSIFNIFRRMPTANAEGLGRIGGRHRKGRR